MRKILLGLLLLLSSAAAYGETYAHYFSVARTAAGVAIPGATVQVYAAGTSSTSVIYNDNAGAAHGNPFLTDSLGNYDFWAHPGMYKITVTKIAVGTFTVDNVSIGTQLHAATHAAAGTDPLSLTGLTGTSATPQKIAVAQDGTINSTESTLDVQTSGTIVPTVSHASGKSILALDIKSSSVAQSMMAANSVGLAQLINASITNAKIDAAAAILESKLALNFPTHTSANDPSAGQKAALAGTSGTPGGGNKYVTNADTRMSDSRTPVAHASSHTAGGSDPISIHASQISDAGSDLTQTFSLLAHKTQHQDGGSDEILVTGLSGLLADPQKITVKKGGTTIGTRPTVNFIEGGNTTLTVTDNSGANRVDVQVDAMTGAPSAHAASHKNGGSDEVATATPGANAIPKAGGGGTLASGWIPTLNQNTSGTAAGLSATLAIASGGTNLTSATDDNVMVGNGTTWQSKPVPDCTDVTGNHLNYTASTNTLSCGTSGGGGGGLSNPLSAGSVAANALQIVDAGTGLYQDSTHTLDLAANGLQMVHLLPTTSGVSFLQFTNDVHDGMSILSVQTTEGGFQHHGLKISSLGQRDIRFETNGIQRFSIKGNTGAIEDSNYADGNVSINQSPGLGVPVYSFIAANTSGLGEHTRDVPSMFVGGTEISRWNSVGLQALSTTAGTCDSAHRGTFQYTAGGAGVKDDVQVCAKDASDVYSWRPIY